MPLSNVILKQVPNLLTSFRITLIIPFFIYFHQSEYIISFYIFIFAGFTDALDGWLARHYHWQTPFGSFLDPMADKFIVVVSFVLLAIAHQLPWWLVILVFLRDATIAVGILFWSIFIQEKLIFSPTFLSKVNTTLQLLLVVFCLFELAYSPFEIPVKFLLTTLTATTTALSYIHYVWVWGTKARRLLKINHQPHS